MTRPERLDRTLIRVSGPDAISFLNNLLTRDALEGGVQYAALLSPQGKVSGDRVLWSREHRVVVDCGSSGGADVLRRLTMYKLRAQVEVRDISSELVVVVSAAEFDGASADPRLSALGWRKLAAAGGDQSAGD